MSKKSSLHFFSIALLASSIILGGTLIYSTVYDAGAGYTTITDDQNNTYVVEKEDPIKLTIVNDSSCENCSTEKIEPWLKNQIGTQLAVRRLDYSSPEAKELINANEATFLPYLLLDSEVSKRSNFGHLLHHVITKNSQGYYVDTIKLGQPVGRYLDVANYAKDDPEAPRIVADEESYDFGKVRLSDGQVSTEFVIRNEGRSPLELINANTSCGCTSAQIVVGEETSPVYMMAGHQEPVKWRGSLASGEEGKIVVFYDPTVHPELEGDVTREVTLDTNDPNTPQLKLKIDVNQIPQ